MRVGIVGCGQLSRMLALAGLPLGLKFSFIDDAQTKDTVCVDGLGVIAEWQQGQSISDRSFAQLYEDLGRPDCVTVEKEQVDLRLLQGLAQHCAVYPCPEAIASCQHRYREKQLLEKLAIPAASFVHNRSCEESLETLSLPLVVKSCSDGYDGKNQWIVRDRMETRDFDRQHISDDYIIENWVPFEREVSLVSVRARSGEIFHYPLAENIHHNGILKQSIAPAVDIGENLQQQARDYMCRILNELNYVGVLAMECFVTSDQLLVNELAPRVHNSGHWTQMGSITCQFENHLRAITGLPLGSTDFHGFAGMINLIGNEKPPLEALSERSTLHWYNKSARPGRKLGHVNFIGDNYESLLRKMSHFEAISN